MYNKSVKVFFLLVLLLSIFMSMMCYLSVDPMKSCLYLVLSLILLTPYLSLVNEVWYSYFVCMVFLSGIFVILVYFTSMSKYNFLKFNFFLLIYTGLFFVPLISLDSSTSLYSLFYMQNFYLFIFLLLSLIYFMNFSSYFLNYSGALRKA